MPRPWLAALLLITAPALAADPLLDAAALRLKPLSLTGKSSLQVSAPAQNTIYLTDLRLREPKAAKAKLLADLKAAGYDGVAPGASILALRFAVSGGRFAEGSRLPFEFGGDGRRRLDPRWRPVRRSRLLGGLRPGERARDAFALARPLARDNASRV